MTRVAIRRARRRTCRHRFYERLGFVRSHAGLKLPLDESRGG